MPDTEPPENKKIEKKDLPTLAYLQAREAAKADGHRLISYRELRRRAAARLIPRELRPENQQSQPGMAWAISGSGPSRRDPAAAGHALKRFVGKKAWGPLLAVGHLLDRWPQIVGEDLADKTKIESFNDGKLIVRVDKTSLATQLRFMENLIFKRIEEEVGEQIVKEIKILGPRQPNWNKGTLRVRGRGPRDTYG